MQADKSLWPKLGVGWFIFGCLMALWAHAMAAIGAYSGMGPLDFDYPLRMLEIMYGARGLTPYTDFGFIYPPGHVWLYGSLLRLHDPVWINAAIASFNLVLWSICAWQMMRLSARWRWWLGGTVLLVLGGVMPLVSSATCSALWEPLPLLLIGALLVIEVMQRGPSTPRLAALAVVTMAGALFRWDWELATFALETGWACMLWLVALILKSDQSIIAKQTATRVIGAALTALGGVALAMAVFAGVTLASGSWNSARLFVFYLPAYMWDYRRLPLFPTADVTMRLIEVIVGMLLMCLGAWVNYTEAQISTGFSSFLKAGVLLAPCVALLPYAFGRIDVVHVVPITSAVIVANTAAFTIYSRRASRWILLTALAVNLRHYFVIALVLFLVNKGRMRPPDAGFQRAHELTAECSDAFPADARSLFVGQASYNRFTMNSPMFYLLNPGLRPATSFISDDPGVQNSCTFGSRIAADLTHAPRPLVLVLDANPYDPEPNLTASMTSCGKIEAAITSMHAVDLGTCHVGYSKPSGVGRTFRVMVAR